MVKKVIKKLSALRLAIKIYLLRYTYIKLKFIKKEKSNYTYNSKMSTISSSSSKAS